MFGKDNETIVYRMKFSTLIHKKTKEVVEKTSNNLLFLFRKSNFALSKIGLEQLATRIGS